LAPAEKTMASCADRAFRQRVALVGFAPVDFSADFGERDANLTQIGVGIVLDDQYPQRSPPDSAADKR